MPERDEANLLALLDAARRIRRYVSEVSSADEFGSNELVFDATLMNLVVLGEMVSRLTPELRTQHPEIDWQRVKDMRNLIAHDYLGIDAEEVWQICQSDVPLLEAQLEAILRQVQAHKQ